jgi:hypothetical protein
MSKNLLVVYLLIVLALNRVGAQGINEHWPTELGKELLKFNKLLNTKADFSSYPSPNCQSNNERFYILNNVSISQVVKYIYIGRVLTCRSGGCKDNYNNNETSGYEYFEYFMLFDSLGTVKKVKIYNYQATHGYEISAAAWLKQFIGYDGSSNLHPGKQVDAIAGASISVQAISTEIMNRVRCLGNTLEGIPKNSP